MHSESSTKSAKVEAQPEADPGLEAFQALAQRLAQPGCRSEMRQRCFTWWPGSLGLVVDVKRSPSDIESGIFPVKIRTTLFWSTPVPERHRFITEVLVPLAAETVLGTLSIEPESGAVCLVTALHVTDVGRSGVLELLELLARLQVSLAERVHERALDLVAESGLQAPTSARVLEFCNPLLDPQVIGISPARIVARVGLGSLGFPFAGPLTPALLMQQYMLFFDSKGLRIPGEEGLWFDLPKGNRCLIHARAFEHPLVGYGIGLTIDLPGYVKAWEPSDFNCAEARVLAHSPVVGAWSPSELGSRLTVFLPDAISNTQLFMSLAFMPLFQVYGRLGFTISAYG